MTDKRQAYMTLVKKHRAFKFAELLNPSEIEGGRYDGDHVQLWARWQGCLDAEIILVGKDFGGKDFFVKFEGGCDPNSVTNQNLIRLFSCLNIDLGTPLSPNKEAPVFLTNAIAGIVDTNRKGGNRISSLSKRESTREFLRPLIDIVDPRIIIAMGKEAYECVSDAFGIPRIKSMRQALDEAPFQIPRSRLLFPVFHCGGLGLANRSIDKHLNDWRKIAAFTERSS